MANVCVENVDNIFIYRNNSGNKLLLCIKILIRVRHYFFTKSIWKIKAFPSYVSTLSFRCSAVKISTLNFVPELPCQDLHNRAFLLQISRSNKSVCLSARKWNQFVLCSSIKLCIMEGNIRNYSCRLYTVADKHCIIKLFKQILFYVNLLKKSVQQANITIVSYG